MKTINKINLLLMTIIIAIAMFPSINVSALGENKTLLTRAINTCYTDGTRQTLLYSDTDYTAATWDTYSGVLDDALNIEDDEESTQSAIDGAKDALATAKAALVFAGKANLDDAMTAAASKTESDYTVGSWSALATAKLLPVTTNNQVVTKTVAVNNAIAGLITVDAADALITAKTLDDALTIGDYTVASWTILTNALALPETTDALVLAKTTAINNAIAGLITGEAYDALLAAKALANTLVEVDYTTVTWATLTSALALSETIDDEIVIKTTAISNAVSALVFAGKANLDTAKTLDDALVEGDYLVESWATLTTALALSETTNPQIVAKTTAINSAINGLITVEDNGLLDVAKLEATLTESDYTTESWALLTAALALPETTNALVIVKTTAINNAVDGLVFAGKANLDIAKGLDDALVQANYTVPSWAALMISLGLPETTNAEIVAKTTAINNAIAGLITVEANVALLAAKTLDDTLVEADYTTASWTALTNALALSETTNALILAKTTAITNAVNGLVFAGLADLNAAKVTANLKEEINYTADSWTALTTALALSETTNAQLVTKTSAINNAVGSLEASTNLTVLTSKINAQYSDKSRRKIFKLTSTDYTVESWTNYTLAIANGKTVEYNSASLQTDVNNAASAINNAVTGLVFAGKANLDTAKTLDDALVEADYTTTSWTVLTTALALPETTNTEVVAKTTSITDAVTGLVFAGKANLDTAKATVTTKAQADYTAASWSGLTTAMALPETTNALVVTKTNAINNGINGLVFAGKANLDTAKAAAATKVQATYTAASWTALTNALVLPETTNTLVVTKTTSINNAITGLTLAKPTIVLGQNIYIKAGTRYWTNAAAAKAGIGGYVIKTGRWLKVTRLVSNGCFNVTGDLGWFNPSLL